MYFVTIHLFIFYSSINLAYKYEYQSSETPHKLQVITRVRNLTSIQQGGPAKLGTYKMRTLNNGKDTEENNIRNATINSTRESKV